MSSVGGGGPFFSLPVMAALLWASLDPAWTSLDPAWTGGYTRVGGLRAAGVSGTSGSSLSRGWDGSVVDTLYLSGMGGSWHCACIPQKSAGHRVPG